MTVSLAFIGCEPEDLEEEDTTFEASCQRFCSRINECGFTEGTCEEPTCAFGAEERGGACEQAAYEWSRCLEGLTCDLLNAGPQSNELCDYAADLVNASCSTTSVDAAIDFGFGT